MAENKKSFILYADQIHTAEELTDEEAGRLYKHLLRYVNDMNPEPPDRITKIAFEPIKQQLKRDLRKYELIKTKRSEAGKMGGRPIKAKDDINEQVKSKKANALFEKQTKAKKADNDNVNDNVNVNDNIRERERENIIPTPEVQKIISMKTEKEIKPVFKEISTDTRWLEVIAMNYKLKSVDRALDYLEKFMNKLRCEGTEYKSINDTKSHFSRWLNIELNHAK